MTFSFYSTEKIPESKFLYISNEYAFTTKPFCSNIDVGILFGASTELGIISETKEVSGFSGYSPKSGWKEKELDMPSSRKCRLLVDFKTMPIKGVCLGYNPYCETFFDKKTQIICVGDYNLKATDDYVEFASDMVAVLREGDLVALWTKIEIM